MEKESVGTGDTVYEALLCAPVSNAHWQAHSRWDLHQVGEE
jgi:hypothetical protein